MNKLKYINRGIVYTSNVNRINSVYLTCERFPIGCSLHTWDCPTKSQCELYVVDKDFKMIKNNKLKWATQHLQSDNHEVSILAQDIINNQIEII